MRSFSIKQRLLILVLLPLALILYFIIIESLQTYRSYQQSLEIKKHINTAMYSAEIIHELQRERGLSASYLSGNDTFFYDALKKQYEITDKAINRHNQQHEKLSSQVNICQTIESLDTTLNDLRQKTMMRHFTYQELMKHYSRVNLNLLKNFPKAIRRMQHSPLLSDLIAYNRLQLTKEYLGQARAYGASMLFSKPDIKVQLHFSNLAAIYKTFYEKFRNAAREHHINRLESLKFPALLKEINDMQQQILLNRDHVDFTPQTWFGKLSQAVRLLKKVDIHIASDIIRKSAQIQSRAVQSLIVSIAIFILFFIFLIVMAAYIVKDIISRMDNVKNGLQDFVFYLKDPAHTIRPIDYLGDDELDTMASTINENISEAIKLHKEIYSLNQNLKTKLEEASQDIKIKEKLLLHQSRMAQMGEMINMIAHQWRQPLTSISSITSLMKLKSAVDECDKEFLSTKTSQIEDYVIYLSQTINDFRSFFHSNKEKELFLLQSAIDKSLYIIKPSIEAAHISIHIDNRSLKPVYSFSNELEQVVINLLKNAVDAHKESLVRTPKIGICCYDDETYAYLEICDNAGGIDETIIENIFDPYFTTKSSLNGTGIGLYMSKIIIEEHCKGSLDVANKEGGACFTIRLRHQEILPD